MSRRKRRILIGALAVLVVFAGISVDRYLHEDFGALTEARLASGDEFLETPHGVTRYRVFDHRDLPTVVMIHSFNGYLESWNPNVRPLTEAGYRVVVYDLLGRGLSDRPRTRLGLDVFREQLHALIESVGASRVHLVGSSFGCVIASDYAMHYPERVGKLVLTGPAGWPADGYGGSTLAETPLLGDLLFLYFGNAILRSKVESYLYDRQANRWTLALWDRFAEIPGLTRAALSTLRHSPVLDYTDGWKALGESGKPTLFIWGKRDVSFPFDNTRKAAALIPHAGILGVDDAAHWVNVEKPDIVNRAVVSFLEQ